MTSSVAMTLRAMMIKRVFIDYHPELPVTWVALCWTPPLADSWGMMLNEPSIGNYSRVPYGMGSAYWQDSLYGEVQNTQLISFSMATYGWGNLAGWALMDSLAIGSGHVLACGSLQQPFDCRAGDVPTIARFGITVGVYA